MPINNKKKKQVQGAEHSQFDAQQLNLALRSVVEKLEKKVRERESVCVWV